MFFELIKLVVFVNLLFLNKFNLCNVFIILIFNLKTKDKIYPYH